MTLWITLTIVATALWIVCGLIGFFRNLNVVISALGGGKWLRVILYGLLSGPLVWLIGIVMLTCGFYQTFTHYLLQEEPINE